MGVSSLGTVKVKLRNVSVLKLSYLFCFFGILFGLMGGIPFFILIRALIDSWTANVPVSGLMVLSFIVFPIISAFFFWIVGLISGLLFNLILRIIHGLDIDLEELG